MPKEQTPEGSDPQILFATTNIGDPINAFQTAFHHPEILGNEVRRAGFDGVALQPQYMMRHVDMVAKAIASGDLQIGSLLQSPLHFHAGQVPKVIRPQRFGGIGARIIRQTWSESLEYFRQLQDNIGQRPAIVYSHADQETDEVTKVLANASSYAVRFTDELAQTWQADNRLSVLDEAGARGFTACLDTHSSYRKSAAPYVVSTALDSDAHLPAIAAAATDVHVSLMKRRVAQGQPDPASLDEVVSILQKNQLPVRVRRIARAVMSWGNPQRVVLQLGAKDMALALAAANMGSWQTEPGEMRDVWGGYRLIGQVLRKEFSM